MLRPRTLRSLLTLIALALLGADPAVAVVVDEFEEGPFSFSGDTTWGSGVQFPLTPSSALGGSREVRIFSPVAGQFASADLVLTPGDDSVVVGLPASGGQLTLIYRPAATDLTEGGAHDRLVIEVDALPPGAALVLTVEDAAGGSAAIGPPISGAGTFPIQFADVPSIDFSQVDFVRLDFLGSGAGGWQIRDVRTSAPPPPVPGLSLPLAGVGLAMLVAAASVLIRDVSRHAS